MSQVPHNMPPKPKKRSFFGLTSLGTRPTNQVTAWMSHPLADYYLVTGCTVVLVGMGLLMVASASSVWSSVVNGSSYYYLIRQVVFLIPGAFFAWLASRMSAPALKLLAWVAMIVAIVLLVLVFSPLGVEAYGNRAWIQLGAGSFSISLQPSEFAKFALIVWASAIWSNRTKTLHEIKRLLVPVLPGFLLILGLVVFEHDMGTASVIGLIMLAMLWIVGTPVRILLILGGGAAAAAFAGIAFDEQRRSRVFSFLGMSSQTAVSDQPLNAIYALASGGWWGLGLGHSRQKWGGLYNGAQTDYILAVLGEEMGLFGTLIVLGLFFILAFVGFRIAARSANSFFRYAAAGVTAWIIMQALINIFVVMRLLPVLGVPLPFLSQGGSALLANLAGIGVLMAAARNEPHTQAFLEKRKAKDDGRATMLVSTNQAHERMG